MIVKVEAKFSCDECGAQFTLALDPAYSPPGGWSVFDIAEDAIRSGRQYSDETGVICGLGGVDGDSMHYCDSCNSKRGGKAE